MQITMLKSKLHTARVTEVQMDYEGSLMIDSLLMNKVNILPYEKILIANLANGERFETYAIPGEPGSGIISLNGATAYKGKVGDKIIIFAFATISQEEAHAHKPLILVLDENNHAPLGLKKT